MEIKIPENKGKNPGKVFGKKIKIVAALEGKVMQCTRHKFLSIEKYIASILRNIQGKVFVYYVREVSHTTNHFTSDAVYTII